MPRRGTSLVAFGVLAFALAAAAAPPWIGEEGLVAAGAHAHELQQFRLLQTAAAAPPTAPPDEEEDEVEEGENGGDGDGDGGGTTTIPDVGNTMLMLIGLSSVGVWITCILCVLRGTGSLPRPVLATFCCTKVG